MMIERPWRPSPAVAYLVAIAALLVASPAASAQKGRGTKESDARLLLATLQREGKDRVDSVERVFGTILENTVVRAHPAEVARLRLAWSALLRERSRIDSIIAGDRSEEGAIGRHARGYYDSLMAGSNRLYAETAARIVEARALLALHPEVTARFDEEFPVAVRSLLRDHLARLRGFQARQKPAARRGSDAEEIKEMIGDLAPLEANRWQLRLMTEMRRRSFFPTAILDSSVKDSASVALVMESLKFTVPASERDFGLALIDEEMERWNREYWGEKLGLYRQRIEAALTPADRARVDSLRGELAAKMIKTHWDDGEDIEMLIDRATAIASRYRSVLAPIKPALIDDIVRFNDLFPNRAEAAIDAHRGEFPDDVIDDIYEQVLTTVTTYSSELGRERAVRMYPHLIEPALLVAGTEDILDLAILSRLTRQIDWEEHGDAVIDSISARSATGSVTVRYALAEEDSMVTLVIRDRAGKSYGAFPQGARGPGSHEAILDCSAIPDGTYLCVVRLGDESSTRTAIRLLRLSR